MSNPDVGKARSVLSDLWLAVSQSNPEREHRQTHGKLLNVSFATKKALDNLHTKVISTSVCAAGLSLCGSSCSWTNRTSLESEFAATNEPSLTRPVGGYPSHGSRRCHGGVLQQQLG